MTKKRKYKGEKKSGAAKGDARPAGSMALMARNVLSLLKSYPEQAFSTKQLLKELRVTKQKARGELVEVLLTLEEAGAVKQTPNREFMAVFQQPAEYVGIVDYVNPAYGFVITDDLEEDIWISTPNLNRAFDGDKVRVQLINKKGRKRYEGKVLEVLERATTEFAGTLKLQKDFGFVDLNGRKAHHDFFIPKNYLNNAEDGEKVVVEMKGWSAKDKNPVGEIKRVLGAAGENDTEIHSIMFEFGLPFDFPKEVEREAERISSNITEKDIKSRRDFRDITTFTIDPINAKDFDDALSIRRTEEGHLEVGIHIADVTHYVKPDTHLEREALNRATSVYLVDRVVPMLPENLSNGLCSLRPNEDKLTFAAVFELDHQGDVLKEWFGRTIIHSDRRFTYEEAQERIDSKKGDFQEEINSLNALAHKLKKKRFQKGAIGFESIEYYFELDDQGKPVALHPKVRKDAHKLVEEFMLLANQQVANFVYDLGGKDLEKTMVYRVHENPDPEKLQQFAQFASRFGHAIDLREKKLPHSLNRLSAAVEGKPEQRILEQQAIRSMAKAKYTTEPLGHYGLAFNHYSHFTSPIRRYPDMMAHRLLQLYLDKQPSPPRPPYEDKCKHSSEREKRAAQAERASIKYKQVEFMQQYVGHEMEGIISGLTEWGMFVEVKETRCEGMVRLSAIEGDYYDFNEDLMQVVGKRSQKTFNLGDEVRVLVAATNLDKRLIDFDLVQL